MGDQDTIEPQDFPEPTPEVAEAQRRARQTLDDANRARQRVHEEAANPTADWIELADDPDAPSVVTDAAVEAAARTFFPELQTSKRAPISALVRDDMRRALTAALPHLTGSTYAAGFKDGTEREHMANTSASEAFRRGVTIGRAEGEARVIDVEFTAAYPTDHDIWRDALLFSATITAPARNLAFDDDQRRRFILTADWFVHQLTRGRIAPGALADDPEDEHEHGEMVANAPADDHREPDRD